jgi:hypothetical protein
MPQIPGEFFPTVQPEGQQAYNTIDKSSPENFGAQVGQTLSQTGDMLAQHAMARQQILNAAKVDDTYAKQFDPAARDIFYNFLKLKGKDAEDQYPAVQKQMQDLADQTAQGLDNQMQVHQFNEVSRRRMTSDLDSMSRHAAAESNSFVAQTVDATGGVYMNRMVDVRNDPNAVQGLVNNINTIYTNRGTMLGQSPATSKMQAANVIDSGIAKVIQADLDRQDPQSAQNSLDHYGNYLSNEGVKNSLQAKISPALDKANVAGATQDFMTRFNPADPNVNMVQARQYADDPKNYPGISNPDQRNTIWNTFAAERNVAAAQGKANQDGADEAFMSARNQEQIKTAQDFRAWTDPKTGLAASPQLVDSAIQRSLHPERTNTEDNREIYTDFANRLYNRAPITRTEIQEAFIDGHITGPSMDKLEKSFEYMEHPDRSPDFVDATNSYMDRYGKDNKVAAQYFPQFIATLKRMTVNQNLHGQDIMDEADKMMADVDGKTVNAWFKNTVSALDYAKYWGTFPEPALRDIHNPMQRTGVIPNSPQTGNP